MVVRAIVYIEPDMQLLRPLTAEAVENSWQFPMNRKSKRKQQTNIKEAGRAEDEERFFLVIFVEIFDYML